MSFMEELGIEVISANTELVELSMPITPEVHQPHGFLHGGATIALLESAASLGAEKRTDFTRELPFGIDVHVRHRKSGKDGMVHASARFDREEGNKQFWNVAAIDDAGDVLSDGVVVTKIVSLERLAEKERAQAAGKN